MKCCQLLEAHPDAWRSATVHPFLEQCKTGVIQPQQFNTWLVQDHLFVIDFTRLVARVLTIAPPHHFDILLAGLGALKDELNWFVAKAAERQLDLDRSRQATCAEYCEFMQRLEGSPHAVQAVALWAIELSYNQGWQLPGPMVAPYDEFADRWGNPGFTQYVQLLEQQADEALASAPDAQEAAEAAFLEVARLEKAFWQMAFGAA